MFIHLLLTLLFVANFAESVEMITFQHLSELSVNNEKRLQVNRDQVRIRGFLYTSPDGHSFLATQPNLKSCCFHKIPIEKQIAISGNFKAPENRFARPVTFQGTLVFDHKDSQAVYRLDNATLVEEPSNSAALILSIGGGLLCIAFLGICVKVFRRWKASS